MCRCIQHHFCLSLFLSFLFHFAPHLFPLSSSHRFRNHRLGSFSSARVSVRTACSFYTHLSSRSPDASCNYNDISHCFSLLDTQLRVQRCHRYPLFDQTYFQGRRGEKATTFYSLPGHNLRIQSSYIWPPFVHGLYTHTHTLSNWYTFSTPFVFVYHTTNYALSSSLCLRIRWMCCSIWTCRSGSEVEIRSKVGDVGDWPCAGRFHELV